MFLTKYTKQQKVSHRPMRTTYADPSHLCEAGYKVGEDWDSDTYPE
jgi:hypothetical protein